MQVLIVDDAPSIDGSALQFLHLRGYDVEIARTPDEAFERIDESEFDCILLEVSMSAKRLGLLEMRKLVRTSAVAFTTTMPVESLVSEAEQEGCIEFQCLPVLIENLEQFPQPVMLVGKDLPAALLEVTKDRELRIQSARTLQFAMNLLVDGWCQIVWLHAEIPGRGAPDKAAIFHRIGAKQMAILASCLTNASPGVTCNAKPNTAQEFVALLRHIAGDRLAPCGRSTVGTQLKHSNR